ncbi:hypothetical protein F4810DRAFT_654945 [Camillea tinctor]|nr:hypothetical protein F4810DRAFT_654945 [Camillea tinctor]
MRMGMYMQTCVVNARPNKAKTRQNAKRKGNGKGEGEDKDEVKTSSAATSAATTSTSAAPWRRRRSRRTRRRRRGRGRRRRGRRSALGGTSFFLFPPFLFPSSSTVSSLILYHPLFSFPSPLCREKQETKGTRILNSFFPPSTRLGLSFCFPPYFISPM